MCLDGANYRYETADFVFVPTWFKGEVLYFESQLFRFTERLFQNSHVLHNEGVKLLMNYYARWFQYAFLVGAVVPPVLVIGWIKYENFSTMRQSQQVAQEFGQPITVVTDPFLDITNPTTGKVIASGSMALLTLAIVCGICTGVLGLSIGGLKQFFRKLSR